MEAVLAPVLQLYVPPPVAVNVADLPEQMVALPAVTLMLALGLGSTIMVLEADKVQPSCDVTDTLNVEVAAGLTVILGVVAPVFQTTLPVVPETVSVVDCPLQISSLVALI